MRRFKIDHCEMVQKGDGQIPALLAAHGKPAKGEEGRGK